MRTVFADTFFWIALANRRDPYHARATALRQSLQSERLVTSQEVLVEFLTFFSAGGPRARQAAAQTVHRLRTTPNVQVLPQSDTSFDAGLQLYEARSDKQYSMTDCISMQHMRRLGLTEVLTIDNHFAQEGFVRLIDGP
jgi:predicted nucleic acid-binding protein